MKKVYIIHGYTGSPNRVWYPWLANELRKSEIDVKVLKMPNSFFPNKKSWVQKLKEEVVDVDEETFLIGHSLGVTTILYFLQGLPTDKRIGGALLVSGPFSMPLISIQNIYFRIFLASFFKEKPNLSLIKEKSRKFIVLHGIKDKIVPFSQARYISEMLGVSIISVKNGGHFIKKKVPEILIAAKDLLN